MIDWMKLKDDEVVAINHIAKKACQMMAVMDFDFMKLEMDLQAAHLAVGLDLDQLYYGDNGDFNHDVAGIVANIDRTTGEMRNSFLPRCATKQ